jgi:hypothetical protein
MSIAYGGNVFVVAAASGAIYTSPSGWVGGGLFETFVTHP